jgi:hypothetical protein
MLGPFLVKANYYSDHAYGECDNHAKEEPTAEGNGYADRPRVRVKPFGTIVRKK